MATVFCPCFLLSLSLSRERGHSQVASYVTRKSKLEGRESVEGANGRGSWELYGNGTHESFFPRHHGPLRQMVSQGHITTLCRFREKNAIIRDLQWVILMLFLFLFHFFLSFLMPQIIPFRFSNKATARESEDSTRTTARK